MLAIAMLVATLVPTLQDDGTVTGESDPANTDTVAAPSDTTAGPPGVADDKATRVSAAYDALKGEVDRQIMGITGDSKAAKTKKKLLAHNQTVLDGVIENAQLGDGLDSLDPELLAREFQVDAPRHPYRAGNFSWQVLFGAEFSEAADSFSSPTSYARFFGDTAFRPTDRSRFSWKNWHSVVDIAVATIPVEEEDAMMMEFIDSEKALIGSVGLDWYFYQHPPSQDGYRTQLGLSSRVGLQSIDVDASSDLSSENEFWGAGLTIRTSPAFRYSDPNPLPYAYATVLWGEYDTLGEHVVTFDGMIRFVPPAESELDTTDPWGLFIGMRAVVDTNDGDDDLRFQVGVQDGLALLKSLFQLPGKLAGQN